MYLCVLVGFFSRGLSSTTTNCTKSIEKKEKREKMKKKLIKKKNRKIKYHNNAICRYMEMLVAMINTFLQVAAIASGL